MKRANHTVTVAIIAYNEERSIRRILQSICAQNEHGFLITRILVISDGSTDKTVKFASSVSDARIIVREDGKRKGKAQRINEVFAAEESDVVVIMDADVVPAGHNVISTLVEPLFAHWRLAFTSGRIVPRTPTTRTGNIVHIGIMILDEIKRFLPPENVYSCTGAIRAFRRHFYKKIQFPAIAAEDVFPFFYAAKHGYKFRVVPQAFVYYGLPSTFSDYRRQMNRYLTAPAEFESIFGKEMVHTHFAVRPIIKLYALLRVFLKRPVWTAAYLACVCIPKVRALFRFNGPAGIWETVFTSKI